MQASISRNWTVGGPKPVEAKALYDLLEDEVIPELYARDQDGIPTAWVKRCGKAWHG
jgi:hypothetical protein